MQKKAIVLACAAYAGYGSQMKTSFEPSREQRGLVVSSEAENLAAFLFALHPTLALRPRVDESRAVGLRDRGGYASMNILGRFTRLVKSNVNEALSKMEDPEKVMEQAVADMQKDLVKVRQAYAEVSASSKRMDEQIRVADAEAAKWYERAQLALEKDEDDLAREALTRRQQQMEKADSLRSQTETQKQSLTSLYESMQDLERKMSEAKAKKDQIIARARTAKAATTVNDMLAGIGDSSSVAAFDRMTEKVEQLEAAADVSQQMAKSLPGSGGGGMMEDRFKALEAGTQVDDELAAMKKKLLTGSSTAVDDELANMKKTLGEGN